MEQEKIGYGRKIKNWFKNNVNSFLRWGAIGFSLSFLFSGWIALEIFLNKSVLVNLDYLNSLAYIGKKIIEMILFVVVVKALLTLGPFLNAIKKSFSDIFLEQGFLKSLKQEELLKLAKNIEKIEPSIVIDDNRLNKEAIDIAIKDWKKDDKPYIITKSEYTDTLFKNGTIIRHKRHEILMMDNESFNAEFLYMPYDEDVKEDVKKDDYYINKNTERMKSKTFHYFVPGNNVTLTCNITTEHASNIEELKDTGDDRTWLIFHITSGRTKLRKNDKFILELSLSDIISLSKDETAVNRREAYLETSFSTKKNAVIYYSFQLEKYNDFNENENNILNFEPYVVLDGDELTNRNNCGETIYYRKWNWILRNNTNLPKKLLFNLVDTTKNGLNCN